MKRHSIEQIGFDRETLKRWKNVSIKGKLEWLESALFFGKMRKGRPK